MQFMNATIHAGNMRKSTI